MALLVPPQRLLDRPGAISHSVRKSSMRILMAATAVLCLIGSGAEARSHRHHHAGGHHHAGRPGAWCGVVYAWTRSVATPARRIISPGPGLTMDRMQEAHQSEPSSSGVTTWARSSATRTVSGSCRAAMTAMPFGRVRDRWRVPLRLGRPKPRSKACRRDPDDTQPEDFLFVPGFYSHRRKIQVRFPLETADGEL